MSVHVAVMCVLVAVMCFLVTVASVLVAVICVIPVMCIVVAVMLQPFEYYPLKMNKHKLMVQTMFAPDDFNEGTDSNVSALIRIG